MHWRRKWQPTPVFLPGESQGRGSRLWGRTESDATEATWQHRRFQWKVLPQGMKNSPTLCQKFVDQAVQNVRRYKDLYLIHYMDDILAANKDRALLQQILSELIEALKTGV